MISQQGGNRIFDAHSILKECGVSEGAKVGVMGAGVSGLFVYPSARIAGKYGKVYAVDVLKPALEVIERQIKEDNLENVGLIWSNLEVFGAAKIEAGSLDYAILVDVLSQSQKRPEILREIARMLKKGGKIILIEWDTHQIPFGPKLENRIPRAQLLGLVPSLGYHLDREFAPSAYHYGLLLIKN